MSDIKINGLSQSVAAVGVANSPLRGGPADRSSITVDNQTPTSGIEAHVRVTDTARQLLMASQSTANSEFDQSRVDRLKKAIAGGQFVIDEERLVSKFIELESVLGALKE
jgi:flagellar biosynthesis anti-sigma factor FlgM